MKPTIDDRTVKTFAESCIGLINKGDGPGAQIASSIAMLQSPIEEILYMAMQTVAHIGAFDLLIPGRPIERITEQREGLFLVLPQHQVGRYVTDFLISPEPALSAFQSVACARMGMRWVIECDGYNYHNSTREQVAHDHVRNRYMAQRGYGVIRFLFDEIVESPFGCACDALNIASGGVIRFDDEAGKVGPWPVLDNRCCGYIPDREVA